MRRIPVVLSLFLVLALGAALPSVSAPKPRPTPAPTAAPTAPPAVQSLPIIVVYPFGASSDIPAGDGGKAADLFVQVMNNDGGLDAIGAPASVKKDDYLSYARKVDADYYVTGYMTPLGNGVSLVEQVVSTRSGTMIFGQTSQIDSFADASSQAITIHDGIIAQENAFKQQYQQAQATATATPLPNNQANLGKGLAGLAGLFRHNKSQDKQLAVAVTKPSKGVIVAHVSGAIPEKNLSSATSDLTAALDRFYHTSATTVSGSNVSAQANGICGSNRNNSIAAGTLSAKSYRRGFATHTDWTFVLDVYTCWGAKLSEESATAPSLKDAVDRAVDAYAKTHPENA